MSPMEEMAETLSLLGLPFLISKAANAASDYEAQGTLSSAKDFVEAVKAFKEALGHPGAAGLDASIEDAGPVVHMTPDLQAVPLSPGRYGLTSRFKDSSSPVPGKVSFSACLDKISLSRWLFDTIHFGTSLNFLAK